MPLLAPDLIYYCGQSILWDPRSQDLGGSEQAVVELSRHWAQAGLRVEVYGRVPEAMTCDGVAYRPLDQAPKTLQADVIVLWRLFGLIAFWQGRHRFQCRLLAVDFHDREAFGHEPLLHQSIDRIQALMFKSNFHADYLLGKLPADQQAPLRQRVKVIPNGIRKQHFTLEHPPTREPHRFCYTSCYLRGLEPLIQYFWPSVRQLWPDAELHVYYGMEHVHDAAFHRRIDRLLQSEGVHDHGRQPVSVISAEKHRSSFHLYYTNSTVETDCISIKESAVAGCIPIISGVHVFAERSGVVMPGDAASEQDFRQAGRAFARWAQQISEPELDKIRDSLRDIKTHRDWHETAQLWRNQLAMVPASITWEAMSAIYRQNLEGSRTSTPAVARSEQAPRTDWKLHAIQYINLPGNKGRDTWMRSQLLKTCPAALIHRREAIVGKDHRLSQQEAGFFQNSDFAGSPHFLNIAGNCLSHYQAWQDAARQPDTNATVVMQDDAMLISNFRQHLEDVISQMPPDTLGVFIADHAYAALGKFKPVDLENQNLDWRLSQMKEPVTSLIAKHNDIWADHCSLAYIITPRGGRELLRHTHRHGFQRATDRYLRDVLVRHGMNYCSVRCLATSSSELFASDIWIKAIKAQLA